MKPNKTANPSGGLGGFSIQRLLAAAGLPLSFDQRSPTHVSLLIPIIVFGWISVSAAQDSSDERTHRVRSRLARIEKEIDQLSGDHWAGVYSRGGGLRGRRMAIAPDNGVAYQCRACVGIYDQNCGRLKVVGPELIVDWEFSSTFESQPDSIYIPITWSQTKFLVPRHEILDFCIEARTQTRRRYLGSFLRRTDSEETDFVGQPTIPEEYAKYKRMNHIVGTITDVDPPTMESLVEELGIVTQTVRLSVGEKDGVQPLMTFHLTKRHGNTPTSVVVNSVDGSECRATARVYTWGDEKVPPLTPGMKFTTDFWGTLLVKLGRTKA